MSLIILTASLTEDFFSQLLKQNTRCNKINFTATSISLLSLEVHQVFASNTSSSRVSFCRERPANWNTMQGDVLVILARDRRFCTGKREAYTSFRPQKRRTWHR